MKLTPQEVDYLNRFCYEMDHNIRGEGSIFEQCPDHYQDLGVLVNFVPRDTYQQWLKNGRPEPPKVPLPWKSLKELRQRGIKLYKENT
jgi:hypothetical protein